MNISKKAIDANNAVVTVKIEKADYQDDVQKKLKEYRKKAKMPGFRPGMVPLNMVKKMYGKSLLAETVDKLIVDGLYNYINENKLDVLGQPLPTENQKELDFENGEDFEYSFDLGLAPEFEVECTDKDKITDYNIAISDEMVENHIKSYTQRFGSYQSTDVVEEKDMVKGLIEELENGKVKEGGIKAEGAVLTAGYMKDEEEKKKFIGAKKDDVIVFNPKKAYENETEVSSMLKLKKEEVADLTSDFQVTIQEITRYVESEINQDLFDKAFGKDVVKTEEEFTAKVKENIAENLKLDSEYKFSVDAKDYFVKKYDGLTFPDAFLKRWLLMTNKEMTEEKINEDFPKMLEDLVWQLIKDKIARKEDIKIEQEDLKNYAIKIAKSQYAQYGMVGLGDEIYADYAEKILKDKNSIDNIANRAVEEKVLAKIKEIVTVETKDISMDDFNKMFEN